MTILPSDYFMGANKFFFQTFNTVLYLYFVLGLVAYGALAVLPSLLKEEFSNIVCPEESVSRDKQQIVLLITYFTKIGRVNYRLYTAV